MLGVCLNCLVVNEASSRAIINPRIETSRAANLRNKGIDIIGVFVGRRFNVIIKPATMLPQARRLIGLRACGLFSLIGDNEENRGLPMQTKKTTRRLYTAVNEVARRVRARAQAFK